MQALSDLITTAKNIVLAISNLANTTTPYGNLTSATVTTDTLITTGQGRLINVSVVVAGGGDGKIYNSSTVAGIAAENALAIAPTAAAGVYRLDQQFTAGLVVSPGAGQSLNVTYFQ